jgi:hypothetical protein
VSDNVTDPTDSVSTPSVGRRFGATIFGAFSWGLAWLPILVVSNYYGVPGLGAANQPLYYAQLGGSAVVWMLLVNLPLALATRSTFGETVTGLEIVRWPAQSPPRPAGSVRVVIHLAVSVILCPIDWIPLVIRTRTFHERVAGTVVVQDESRGGLLTVLCILAPICLIAASITVWLVAIHAYLALAFGWGLVAVAVGALAVYGRAHESLPAELNDLQPEAKAARLLHFTPDDLELNRQGRMSWNQRRRLLRGNLGWWITAVICLGAPITFFVGLHSGSVDWTPNFFTSGKLNLMLLFVAGLGLWATYRAIGTSVDAMSGSVRSERTPLKHVMEESLSDDHGDPTLYRLHTDKGVVLRVTKGIYDAIPFDRSFTIYFAPRARKLLGMEVVETDYTVRDRRSTLQD